MQEKTKVFLEQKRLLVLNFRLPVFKVDHSISLPVKDIENQTNKEKRCTSLYFIHLLANDKIGKLRTSKRFCSRKTFVFSLHCVAGTASNLTHY